MTRFINNAAADADEVLPVWWRTPVTWPREKMQALYEDRYSHGMSKEAIAKKYGINKDSVRKYLDEVVLYHPYLDDIAMDRAWYGDADVIKRLSVYEVEELVRRMSGDEWHWAIEKWGNVSDWLKATLKSRMYGLLGREALSA